MIKTRRAFTMIELVFVIVIIGILASVAIPRLSATRDDAEITKARVTVASIRNALAMERQKRILRGDFTAITTIGSGGNVFDKFSADKQNKQADVLEYAMPSSTSSGHWSIVGTGTDTKYIFNQNSTSNVDFIIRNGKFVCADANTTGCKTLTN